MDKKKYYAPNMETIGVDTHCVMEPVSVTGVGGTAGLNRGDDSDVPTDAGSRNSSLWEEDL